MARFASCHKPLRVCLYYAPATLNTYFLFIIILIIGLISFYQVHDHFTKEGDTPRELDYAILVDAGSSGSRVYIYAWPPHSGKPHALLAIQQLQDELGHPLVKKIEPGLATFADQPQQAFSYLAPLFHFAAEKVPRSKHQETPLFIMATAGMRLLPKGKQEAVLDVIRKEVPKNFSFLFSPDYVEVITGVQEGLYLWVALNYVMGRLDHTNYEDDSTTPHSHPRKSTFGVLEMGGASLQVAFEMSNKTEEEKMKISETDGHFMEINLGCQEHDETHFYQVFVATYLGLGANTARDTYNELLLKNITSQLGNSSSLLNPITDPCFPPGYREAYTQGSNNVTLLFRGSGNFDLCRQALIPLLNFTCSQKSSQHCQPYTLIHPLVHHSGQHFYGFSEFWYTMNDALGLGGRYNAEMFASSSREFCGRQWSTLLSWFKQRLYPKSDIRRMKEQCFKSAWLHVLFHEGLGFPLSPDEVQMTSMDKFQGQDIQWTLGALLYRTRYFPLRVLHPSNSNLKSGLHLYLSLSHTILVVCLTILGVVIIIYVRRLSKASSIFSLRKSPWKSSEGLLPKYSSTTLRKSSSWSSS